MLIEFAACQMCGAEVRWHTERCLYDCGACGHINGSARLQTRNVEPFGQWHDANNDLYDRSKQLEHAGDIAALERLGLQFLMHLDAAKAAYLSIRATVERLRQREKAS